jgi:hypothetical protein
MFHFSLPVVRYQECIAFYRSCFDAEIVELTPTAANVLPSEPRLLCMMIRLLRSRKRHEGNSISDPWFQKRSGLRYVIGWLRQAIAS